jgi:hypothetical protein
MGNSPEKTMSHDTSLDFNQTEPNLRKVLETPSPNPKYKLEDL